MKKSLLSLMLFAPLLVCAQQKGSTDANIIKQELNVTVPVKIEPFIVNSPAGNGFQRKAALPYKVDTLGITYYDLQTNASVGRRVLVHDDGKVSVAWTFSPDNTSEFPLRGTAYNHYNGTSWSPAPSSRIENNVRLGWPSIGLLPNGKEYIISHFATSGGFRMLTNDNAGSSNWSMSPTILTTAGGRPIWNRAANNGNTIHLIANYSDSAASTDPPNIKVDGIVLPTTYSRSTDAGQSWSTSLSLLPGYDTSRIIRGAGDQYAIDVRGNTVAIVIADNLGGDVSLWKSTNNGVGFTKTIIDTFRFAPFTSDKVIGNNIPTNDGSTDVVIDANDNVHVFWGYSEVSKNHVSPDSSFFTPASNRIIYWNEVNNEKINIGGAVDMNKDSALTIAPGTFRSLGANSALPRLLDTNGNIIDLVSVARYGNTSLATMPSAVVDDQGRIFCVYSAPLEGDVYLGDVNTSSNYRDVFITFSTDGGKTWANSQNISQGHGTEDVFGCLGKKVVNNVLHVIWQKDEIPGTNLQNNSNDGSHPTVINTIVHAAIPVQAIINNQIGLGNGVGIKEHQQNIYVTANLYPNPVDKEGEVQIFLTESSNITLSVSNLLGQHMATQNLGMFERGNSNVKINTENLPNGVYMYTLTADGYAVSGKMIVTH